MVGMSSERIIKNTFGFLNLAQVLGNEIEAFRVTIYSETMFIDSKNLARKIKLGTCFETTAELGRVAQLTSFR